MSYFVNEKRSEVKMEIRSRFSMNTSLKDAHIFDDDSYDNDLSHLVKKEDTSDDFEELGVNTTESGNVVTKGVNIKTEVKQELFDEETNFPISTEAFDKIHIKKEVLEELTSPMKTDIYENSDSNSRKSLKSAKVSAYRKRDSPYKTDKSERLGSSSRISKPDFDENRKNNQRRKMSKKEFESDPLVLSRRQKQIDYGKNTVGYDEYTRRVPKTQRKSEDPQTPNKYLKYSRRGWDGLIKQWRLKLHKYDPEEAGI